MIAIASSTHSFSCLEKKVFFSPAILHFFQVICFPSMRPIPPENFFPNFSILHCSELILLSAHTNTLLGFIDTLTNQHIPAHQSLSLAGYPPYPLLGHHVCYPTPHWAPSCPPGLPVAKARRGAEPGLAPRASGPKKRLGASGLTLTLYCYYCAHARFSTVMSLSFR